MRKIMNNFLENEIKDKNSVAILFSGGLDSLSILLSCLDIGVKPTLYTFYLETYESSDIKSARRIADLFGLSLTEVPIKQEISTLISDVEYIVNRFHTYKKSAVQCIHPFIYAKRYIKEKYVLSGLCADDLYGTSKHMSIISKDYEQFQNERTKKVKDPISSGYKYIKSIFNDKIFIAPYKECKELIDYFMSLNYKSMNSPKQKYITYTSYRDEIERYGLYRRNENLQCASNIREYHDDLLKTNLNTNGYKIVTPIYRRIYQKYESTKEKVNNDDTRTCTNCGKVMNSGYVINDGEEYFCSDDCLYGYYSDQEYQELCENDLAYWTEW